jgi:phosphatidylserine/phosphatidylglycerophosphate/cardiolipin synthase-like enzyme
VQLSRAASRRISLPLVLLALVLALSATLTAVAPPAAAAYSPKPGPLFNYPDSEVDGSGDGIRWATLQAIRHAPPNSVIRGNTWSFDDGEVAWALKRANDRGVHVKVIVGGNSADTAAVNQLEKNLGTNVSAGSFIKLSYGAARRAKSLGVGAMHQKSWSFSKTGTKRWVTIISSSNPTYNDRVNLYDDGYRFVEYRAVYDKIKAIFAQQKKHQSWATPFRHFQLSGQTALTFSPWNRPDMPDPVLKRIRALPNNSTVTIRVAVSGFNATRGERIARALRAKAKYGATVRVLATNSTAGVRSILRGAGRDVKFRCAPKDGPDGSMHSKFMTAFYRTNGTNHVRTWTGSEIWGPASRKNDELVAMVGNRNTYDQFRSFFKFMWARNRTC